MTSPSNDNGRPQLTWANIIGTLVFLLALVGAGAALVRSQISFVEKEIEDIRSYSLRKDSEIIAELRRREDEIKKSVEEIRAELAVRRNEFVTQPEFRQYERRIDGQLRAIENRLERQNERLRIIELRK